MSKTPSIPPNIPLPEIPKLSEEEIKNLKTYKMSDEKKVYIYEKYGKPLREQEQRKADEELKRKKERRSEWWRTNAIGIITLIIALATLIVTAIK